MSIKTLGLAYCIDNAAVASAIEQQLSSAVDRFEHFAGNKDQPDRPIAEQLRGFNGPVLLIVSDNYLKTLSCMYRGLQMLQDRRSQLFPIIVDGVKTDDQTGQPINIPTHFDRVSDIIQYINFWQDQYLDMRRQKRHLHDIDEDAFNEHLRIMREISSEAGEFLRVLRTIPHDSLEQLEHSDYEAVFRFANASADWDTFKRQRLNVRMTAQPVPPPPPPVVEQPTAPVVDILPEPEPVQETPEAESETDIEAAVPEVEETPVIEELPVLEETVLEEHPQEEEVTPTHESVVAEQPAEEFAPEPTPTPDIEEELSVIFSTEDEDNYDDNSDDEAEAPGEATSLDSSLHELIHQCWSLAEQGQVQEALLKIADAVNSHPNISELRYNYAALLAQKGNDISGATRQLQTLLATNPEYDDAYYLLGDLAEQAGDYEQAFVNFRNLANNNSHYPEVFYRLGLLLVQHFEERHEEASAYFKKAIKRNKANTDAYYQYAVLMSEVFDKPKKAVKNFQETLRLQPHHPFAWYDLALLYHKKGDLKAAAEAYERAAAINPEVKTPENDLAFHYEEPSVVAAPIVNLNLEEHNVIDSLKQTINRLESLLLAREEEQTVEPEPEPPAPKPGEGKTVMVTGATSGIGKATAERFAAEGYRVIITGRRYERLEELQKQLQEEHGVEVEKLCFDVRDVKAVEAAISSLSEDWSKIDILVNNAGKAKGLSSIQEGQLEHWEEMIDTNIKGLLYITRAVSPGMVARRSGHIINLCSTAGKEVYPKGNVYCATKYAVDALTHAMRIDLHTHNIRVSQVSPAHVEETEFALVRFDGDAEKAQIYNDFKPLTSHDVADAIYYMASRPEYVNVLDMVLQGTQQASSVFIDRSGR